MNTVLVSHAIADKFRATSTNLPWVSTPVVYLEGNRIHLLYDAVNTLVNPRLVTTYIKMPTKFVDSTNTSSDFDSSTDFELSDQMAEELINLAITFATEITQSPRLQTKLNTSYLES